MTDEEFMTLVDKGVAALRSDIRDRLKNVAIVVADAPSQEQREELELGPEELLFGLYEGVPQTERGILDQPLLPDKITIFKNDILSVYDNPEDITRCVENTVWHEVAHHFGFDEEAVQEEEKKRGKIH